jgi:hypothetical protein
MSSIPPSLISAYNSTNYHVQSAQRFVLKIGEKSDGLIDLYRRLQVDTSAFITAFNPYSQSLSLEENIKRNELLRNELDNIAWAVIKG